MIRAILSAEHGFLQIQLPADFIGKWIEVIAFPVEEQSQHHAFQVKPFAKRVTVVSVKNKSYKFNRDELYDR